ncbi:hypothetical protein PUR61_00805, partial [Streptomyces sp. BE20]|uniref:hypothetical protein n=1 Tax=Streptomyces sp. BE20 TaxID=3002525 RepID=UPI002E796DFD
MKKKNNPKFPPRPPPTNPATRSNHPPREETTPASDREHSNATYHVENLAATHPDATCAEQAQAVVTNLRSLVNEL